MTITQTVEIPADRKLFLNLPPELPLGKAIVTVIPQNDKPSSGSYEAAMNLRGLSKKMGSTLTVERFLEMKHEDLRLEDEKMECFFNKKSN